MAQAHQLGCCLYEIAVLANLRLYIGVRAEVACPVGRLIFEWSQIVCPKVCFVALILDFFCFGLFKDAVKECLH